MIKVDRLVPIDSKFPLDNFERMVGADNDIERQQFEKLFARDVKGHVDAIASKYIRPDEGTYDFAFMYLPSEAIYYELACGKTGALLEYAHAKRVAPGLADDADRLPAGDHARAQGPADRAARAGGDGVLRPAPDGLRPFREDFELVGKHLDNAQKKLLESEKRLERFETKLEQAADSPAELRAGRGARAPARRRRCLGRRSLGGAGHERGRAGVCRSAVNRGRLAAPRAAAL